MRNNFLICSLFVSSFILSSCQSKDEFKMGALSDPFKTDTVKSGNIPRRTVGSGIATHLESDEMFEVNIESKESAWVKAGQVATVYLVPSEKSFPCKVAKVVKNVSEETGQAIAWLRPDISTHLPLGEFILAQITTDFRREVLLVPKSSVLIQDGETWVLRKSDPKKDEYHPVQVKLGLEDEHQVEVISGLSLGDTIITQGGIGLLSSSFSQKGRKD